MSFRELVPTLILIFFLVIAFLIVASFVLRLIINFGLSIARKMLGKKKRATYPKSSKKFIPKEEDERSKKKYTLMERPVQSHEKLATEQDEQALEEVKIVDIVQPVGFWTSMMLGQKLTYLMSAAQLINKKSHKGFWVSMVEAQAQAAGRQHGKFR